MAEGDAILGGKRAQLVDGRDAESNRVLLAPQVNFIKLADVDMRRNAEALRPVVRLQQADQRPVDILTVRAKTDFGMVQIVSL